MKFFFSVLVTCSLLGAEPVVLHQDFVHRAGCGPCALVNQLQFGTDAERAVFEKLKGETAAAKTKEIIKRYGGRESPTFRDGRAVFRKDGVTWQDMGRLANWVRGDRGLPKLSENYLDRKKNEDLGDHLARVHEQLKRSLDAGVKPIISFRAFAPKFYEENDQWIWDPLLGHFVTLLEIQEAIAEGEKGFRFRFADSATGKIETGYAFLSEARNFVAIKGDQRNWKWVDKRPFILVNAPSLRLKTQEKEWFLRVIITLNHAVYFDPEAQE